MCLFTSILAISLSFVYVLENTLLIPKLLSYFYYIRFIGLYRCYNNNTEQKKEELKCTKEAVMAITMHSKAQVENLEMAIPLEGVPVAAFGFALQYSFCLFLMKSANYFSRT